MKKKTIITILLMSSLVCPTKIFSKIGVGIGTSKIEMNEALNPGSLHELPSLSIVNTGDEPSEYEVGVEYQEDVPQMRPLREWFVFDPQQFHLEPGENKVVKIFLDLPVKAVPGNYFAYLEGRPLKKSVSESGTAVGVAAATKLYFSIKPASFLAGIYYRLNSLWTKYAPWSYVAVLIILLAVIMAILRRFITFNVGIGLKKEKEE
ncbi:MAG TPA: hypothetical protein VK254_00900 [Candidatus Bathyarchaeia archaeon]|nr:hypothetical protein [Candidatus Bathyarchaeia archaeon]